VRALLPCPSATLCSGFARLAACGDVLQTGRLLPVYESDPVSHQLVNQAG
jgi:hypothetical protein